MRISHNALIVVFVMVVVGLAVCGPLACATPPGRATETVLPSKGYISARLEVLHTTVPTIQTFVQKDTVQKHLTTWLKELDAHTWKQGKILENYKICVKATAAAAVLWDTEKAPEIYADVLKLAEDLVFSKWSEFHKMNQEPSRLDKIWRVIGPEQTVDRTARYIAALKSRRSPLTNSAILPRDYAAERTADKVYPWKYYAATDAEIIYDFQEKLIHTLTKISSQMGRQPKRVPSRHASEMAIRSVMVVTNWEISQHMPGWFNSHIVSSVLGKLAEASETRGSEQKDERSLVSQVMVWWWLGAEAAKPEPQRASRKMIGSFQAKLATCIKYFSDYTGGDDFGDYQRRLLLFKTFSDELLRSSGVSFPIDLTNSSTFFLNEGQFRQLPMYEYTCDGPEIVSKRWVF